MTDVFGFTPNVAESRSWHCGNCQRVTGATRPRNANGYIVSCMLCGELHRLWVGAYHVVQLPAERSADPLARGARYGDLLGDERYGQCGCRIGTHPHEFRRRDKRGNAIVADGECGMGWPQ